MLVRLASPAVAAGSITCAQPPIWVGTMSTSTTNRPPLPIASMIAVDLGLAVAGGDGVHRRLHQVGAPLVDALELAWRSAWS